MEIWKPIVINNEITNYEISNLGRCRNITKLHWKSKGILKPKVSKNGYVQYCIVHKGNNFYKYAHRLVAEAFIKGNTSLQINHKDGDKQNNKVENLEWVTHKENMRHCFDVGLSSVNKPIEQYTLKGEFIREYPSASEVGRILGFNVRAISNALIGKTNQSYGYQWKFKNDSKIIKDISNEVKLMNLGVVQLTMDGELIREFSKITEAYKFLGKTDNGVISQVCKDKRNSYLGYKWMYSSDYYNNK
jgi:hypothetical protein